MLIKSKIIKLFLSVLVTFFSVNLFSSAMSSGAIKGRVIDQKTGDPLHGVNVFIEHTTVGAATDENGLYHIHKAPVGHFHLVASFMGYDLGQEHVDVKLNQQTVVNFKMKQGLVEMGSVVVTGTATPHVYTDTPVRTEVVPRKIIEQKNAMNLAEALDLQNGVRVENNCQNCNFTQVRINGLEGKYTEILVDGDPVMSTLAGVYGLEQIPEEMIQQIEIVKGGGSALYGGGAVGGVINLITGKPMHNATRVRYLYNSIDGEMDQRVSAISEIASKSGKSGAYLFATGRQRDPYDYNGDGFSELGELKHESFGLKWFYNPAGNSKLTAQLHRIHETRRGGNMLDQPKHEAQITEAIETWRWSGTLRWAHRLSSAFDYYTFYSFAYTQRNSFYGGLGDDPGWNEDQNRLDNLAAYGRSLNPLHITGTKFNYQTRSHLFTGGVEYKTDHLEDQSVSNAFHDIDEVFSNFGVFLQDNLHFLDNEALEFIVGARLDKHSELEDLVLSPRLTTKYQVSDGLALRGALTTGFKAPQIFDEDLHIMAIDGKQRVIRNVSGLKEESSVSFSGGFDFQPTNGHMPFLFSVSGFYTRLDDAFALESDVEDEEAADYITLTRINTDGAIVAGVEFNLAARMTDRLELRSGFTYKQSEYDSEYEAVEGVLTKDFMRTPDLYGNVSLSYEVSPKLTLTGALNYTGPAMVPNEEPVEGDPYITESDSFMELDLGCSVFLPFFTDISPQLNLGVKNIMNVYQDDLEKGAARNSAYLYGPAQPRTIYFGIETVF